MAYKIRWTAIALEDYEKVIDFLIKMWSVKVAIGFEEIVNKKLANLSGQPFIGIASEKKPMVRSIYLQNITGFITGLQRIQLNC